MVGIKAVAEGDGRPSRVIALARGRGQSVLLDLVVGEQARTALATADALMNSSPRAKGRTPGRHTARRSTTSTSTTPTPRPQTRPAPAKSQQRAPELSASASTVTRAMPHIDVGCLCPPPRRQRTDLPLYDRHPGRAAGRPPHPPGPPLCFGPVPGESPPSAITSAPCGSCGISGPLTRMTSRASTISESCAAVPTGMICPPGGVSPASIRPATSKAVRICSSLLSSQSSPVRHPRPSHDQPTPPREPRDV